MNNLPVVLYVEDDPQSRKLMRMLLKGRMNLPHVTILENSEDFLAKVEALDPKPDLIFLDIHVKPYDGFEMLRMLRQLDSVKGTPVVALTASVMNEEVQQLRTAGFNGCLAKPIDLATFPETVASILAGEIIWRITG
ncbi:MAG TPA: response regulator [Phototrophicaceae bacterium]|nr:response regulator [Phototrophicaceae bacterium]